MCVEDDEQEDDDKGEYPHGGIPRVNPLLHDCVGGEDENGHNCVSFCAGVWIGRGLAHGKDDECKAEYRPCDDVVDCDHGRTWVAVDEGDHEDVSKCDHCCEDHKHQVQF